MSTLSQFYSGGSGGTPLGAYIDLPASTGSTYTTGSQAYLRSGQIAPASSYPQVPSDFVGLVPNYELMAGNTKYPLPYTGGFLNNTGGVGIGYGNANAIVPSIVTNNSTNNAVYTAQGVGYVPASVGGTAYKMAANGNTIIAFPVGYNSTYDGLNATMFCRSTDGGVTYEYLLSPWINSTANAGTGGMLSNGYLASNYGAAGVFYINTSFIVITRNGMVFKSTDNGSTWSKVNNISYSNGKIGRVKLANGRLFILPDGSMPYSSSTGQYGNSENTSANTRRSGTSSNIIYWSADGVTWNQITMPFSAQWCDIAHNGSVYAAITYTGRTDFLYTCTASGDPTNTWAAQTPGGNGWGVSITAVGSQFVMASDLYSYNTSDYFGTYTIRGRRTGYSSNNGVTWNTVWLLSEANNNSETGVYANQNTAETSFHYDGSVLWLRAGKVYKSSNAGVSWTEQTTGILNRATFTDNDLVYVNSAWRGISLSAPMGDAIKDIAWATMINFYSYTTANLYSSVSIDEQVSNGLTVEKIIQKDTNNIILMPGVFGANNSAITLIDATSEYYYVDATTTTGGIKNRYQSYFTGVNSGVSSFGFTSSNWTFGFFKKYTYSTDGGVTWQHGNLPYMASWSVPGLGQSGDIYIAANASYGQSQSLHPGSMTTPTQDLRVYKTSNLSVWSRLSDMPSSTMQVWKFFTNYNKSATIMAALVSNNIYFYNSTDNGTTWNYLSNLTINLSNWVSAISYSLGPYGNPPMGGYYIFLQPAANNLRILDPIHSSTYSGFFIQHSTGSNTIPYSYSGAVKYISTTDNWTTSRITTLNTNNNDVGFALSGTSSINLLMSAAYVPSGRILVSFGEKSAVTNTQAGLLYSDDSGASFYNYNINWFDSSYTPNSSPIWPVYVSTDPVTGYVYVRYQSKIAVSKDYTGNWTVYNSNSSLAPLPYNANTFMYSISGTGYNFYPSYTSFNNYFIARYYYSYSGFQVYNKNLWMNVSGYAKSGYNGNWIQNQVYISPQTGVVKYMRVA